MTGRLSLASLLGGLCLRAARQFILRVLFTRPSGTSGWANGRPPLIRRGNTQRQVAEADVLRIAGEIALRHPDLDAAKAEAYFERALAVARQQQAKSWELRAAMSMARLWRDQGRPRQARELLAPVYGWFTEGFDTRDLMEAKALLQELAS